MKASREMANQVPLANFGAVVSVRGTSGAEQRKPDKGDKEVFHDYKKMGFLQKRGPGKSAIILSCLDRFLPSSESPSCVR